MKTSHERDALQDLNSRLEGATDLEEYVANHDKFDILMRDEKLRIIFHGICGIMDSDKKRQSTRREIPYDDPIKKFVNNYVLSYKKPYGEEKDYVDPKDVV
jgi:hypothetical protein